ncbi:MAG: DUF4149 domain-containing protein [Verrucomicrobiota bacterium]
MFRSIWLLGMALWLGSAFGVSWLAIPAVFSPGYRDLAGPYAAGQAAQAILARLFIAQYFFCGLACLALLARRSSLPQFPGRLAAGIVPAVAALTLAAGLVLQPRLRTWNDTRHDPTANPGQKARATARFRVWHGVSQGGNLAAMAGLTLAFLSAARRTGATPSTKAS